MIYCIEYKLASEKWRSYLSLCYNYRDCNTNNGINGDIPNHKDHFFTSDINKAYKLAEFRRTQFSTYDYRVKENQ